MKNFPLKQYSAVLLPLLIAGSSICLLRNYFFPQFQILMGILIAPFVFRVREKGVFSNRYFYAALLFLLAYYTLCMKLFLFLALGAFLFYSIESRFGKIGLLPLIFLISISPALHYLVTMFTFSLRLAMSHYAADLLNAVGYPVTCHGNYFTLPDGFIFNVDKACLGLNMFNTGLAFTTLLLGLSEKKWRSTLPLFHLCMTFVTACALLIASNFLRIVIIVLFKSMPGTLSHELIGIFSLLVYVALPLHWLINKQVKKYGRQPQVYTPVLRMRRTAFVFPLIAFTLLFFSFKSVEQKSKTVVTDEKLEKLILKGFSKTRRQDSVMEFRKDSLLVYIKPAVKAFESDHPPALCWKGSGFDVEQVEETSIGNRVILTAQVRKDATKQYTAWWYDNGTIKTTDQWTWRLAKGEPFRIINITCKSRGELLMHCRDFLERKIF
ncbi:MAG: exosortase N [Bacteroidota bacterium]